MGNFSNMVSGASSGLTRGFQALAGGRQGYQQEFDNGMLMQSKLAQAAAAARAHGAQADQTEEETNMMRARPDRVDEALAAQTNTSLPIVQAFRELLRTGQSPMRQLMGPPNPDGAEVGQAPVIDDETRTMLGKAFSRMLPMYTNVKDTNPEHLAKATQIYRENDLGDQVISGALPAVAVGRSQAAVGAKPMYSTDSTGSVLDLFGGALDTNNPMAGSTINLRNQQAGAQKANAAQSYASAENSRASAAKTRQEMADGVSRGGSKPPTEGQAKALMFGSRMAAADDLLNDLEKAGGATQPGRLKQAVEAMPVIGTAAGMGVNLLPSALGGPNDGQQLVEQAQRDFINAILRRESGAVIADSEFRNAQAQYFPQPGDSPAVRRQKAANRKTTIEGLKAEFGEAMIPEFDRIVGEARAARSPAQPGKPLPRRASGATPAGLTAEEAAELEQLRARFPRGQQ